MTVAAVVLAAGASRRLGRPKQLLELHGATLLDATLATVRSAGFDQVLVTLGGAADEVRDGVDLSGVEAVTVPDYGDGCSASLRSAIPRVHADADGIVLLLGDQPGVAAAAIAALLAGAAGSAVGVCRYDDGPGHPLWFRRDRFDALQHLHGDKAVWKLVDAGEDVAEVRVAGPVPPDVDTWEDYQALLARAERAGHR
jgi:molybdenum cofactor cytidylyltransferase